MKSFFVIAMLVAAALASPADDRDAVILRSESDNIGVDGYRFVSETSNGIQQQEEGQLVNVGTKEESLEVRGQYSYTGQDGVVYTVVYVADKNGFQPQGAHLPQA